MQFIMYELYLFFLLYDYIIRAPKIARQLMCITVPWPGRATSTGGDKIYQINLLATKTHFYTFEQTNHCSTYKIPGSFSPLNIWRLRRRLSSARRKQCSGGEKAFTEIKTSIFLEFSKNIEESNKCVAPILVGTRV